MNKDALSPDSIQEFLDAYPFNTERVEREGKGVILLVSSREDNFELQFDPLRLDGLPIPIYDLLERIAPGDESAVDDYKLHVARWQAMDEDSFLLLHDRLEGDPEFTVNGENANAMQFADQANVINVEMDADGRTFDLDSMSPLPTVLIDQNTFLLEHPEAGKLRFVFVG